MYQLHTKCLNLMQTFAELFAKTVAVQIFFQIPIFYQLQRYE